MRAPAKDSRTIRREDKERQQRRRNDMVAEGAPETHAVDRAISEALAYVITSHGAGGARPEEIQVSAGEVLQVAGNILALRYDPERSAAAVVKRAGPRPKMRWSLEPPRRRRADDI